MASERYARKMAQQISKIRGCTFRAYLCSCGLWHVKDLTKKRQRARLRAAATS